MKHESVTNRFLEVLRKNRTSWESEEDLVKIVQKMEKGKNLNKEEFSKVQWLLWDSGHKGQLYPSLPKNYL